MISLSLLRLERSMPSVSHIMTYVFSINHIHGRVMLLLLANHVHSEISGICYPHETSAFECRVFIQLHDIITHLILSYRYLSGGGFVLVGSSMHIHWNAINVTKHSYNERN